MFIGIALNIHTRMFGGGGGSVGEYDVTNEDGEGILNDDGEQVTNQ